MKSEYDAIIVGSGFGAAPPALRLVRAGLSTLVIEKGPFIDPLKDFRHSQDPNYLLKYLKSIHSNNLTLNYAEALGGGSGFFEKIALRAPDIIFNQVSASGGSLWPGGIDRKMLDRWYAIGEGMLKIHQISLKNVPKTGLVFAMLMKNLNYSVERCRYADSFCSGCGYCAFGCVHGGKESLLVNYLPAARDHGADFLTDMEVTRISPIGDKHPGPWTGGNTLPPFRFEITATHRNTGEIFKFRTRIAVLAAGTVGTASLLLKSKPFLPFISRQLGKNIAINGNVKAAGLLPEGCPDGDMFTGQSHPGIISYEFFNSHGIMISAFKALPLQIFGVARITFNDKKQFWGEDHVRLVKDIRKRVIFLDAHGVTPPGATITLDKNNLPKVSMGMSRDMLSFYSNTKNILNGILLKNGCRLLNMELIRPDGFSYRGIRFSTAHQVGSCRMAENIDEGVVDPSGEVFNYKGMYITDGSAIPASTGVNISLTILANAERITHGIIEKLRN